MQKQWIIDRSGSKIRLVNSWFGGTKLYIDGELKDHERSMFVSSKYPVLSGVFINADGEREVLEVFARSKLLSVEFVVTSNGNEIFRAKQ